MPAEAISNASPQLVELSFGEDIERLTADFVGREWVFEQIDKWIRDSDETFFILTGEAGVGKSAIAARLTQIRDDIAAHHLCIAGRNSTIVPGTVLRSIAAQLGAKLPDYGLALANTIKPTYLSVNVKIDVGTMNGGQITGVVINNLTIADPKQEIESLLTAPLSAMPAPARPVLILLDSLDEAFTYNPDENLVTLLAGLNNLPRWVRIILTSRSEDRVLSYFVSVPTHIVGAESQMNREDLRRYVGYRVGKPSLSAHLQAAPKPIAAEALVERVSGVGDDPGLAGGNFLYTKILLDDIESGVQPLDDLSALPKSLDEIYQGFLLRLAPQWETRYQPLLAVLAVAREPLTCEQLLRFGDQSARLIGGRMSATLVNLALGVLVQFLDVRGAPGSEQYSLFHQSLRDYLGATSRSGRFACPPEDGHRAIAAYYLEHAAKDWNTCDDYGRRQLPWHATKADELQVLLTQPDFWLHVEPAALRNALDMAPNLSKPNQEMSSIFSLAYPDLLDAAPSVRAAVLHLTALKQAATAVATFFKLASTVSPWHAEWTNTVPRIIPYRQRKTVGRVKALTAAIVTGRLNIVTLEESANQSEYRLSVWAPVEDEIRSTIVTSRGKPRLHVFEVDAQTYIEIRTQAGDSEFVALLAYNNLELIYEGWNSAITVWREGKILYTVEADFAGAIYLRPLGSPAMYLHEGKSIRRSPETSDETPIARLDSRVRWLQPFAIGSDEPVLAAVDAGQRLTLLFPRQDRDRISLALGPGTPVLKEVTLRGMPVLAVLNSADQMLLVDPEEGHLLARISMQDMETLSRALHQIDMSLVEDRNAAFVVIASQDSEVLVWDIASRRFTHKHDLEQLATIDSIEFEGRALVLTGHATSIRVWNAQQLTEAAAQNSVEEVVMTTAAAIDGRAMVAVLAWVDARKSMRLTVRDGQSGEPLYVYERSERRFAPHFLALCRTTEGPCVILQSDWWRDEIEFHRILSDEEVVRASLEPHSEFTLDDGIMQANESWWPEQFTDVELNAMSVSHSQINPSMGLEAFVKHVFPELPGLAEFWAGNPSLVVTDPIGRGLAATYFFKPGQVTPEEADGLVFLTEQAGPAIILDEDKPDDLAATVYNGRYIAVTVDKRNRTLLKWRPEAGSVLQDDGRELLLKLETGAPILAMGTVAGQLVLAVGQDRGVTVIPLSEGPVHNNLFIAERATAISFAPHDMLIVGTSHGVEAFRLGEGPK